MQNKTVLITGCSSGIGLHLAKELPQHGYKVIASARKSKDVSKLKKLDLQTISLDVNDSQSIQQAVAKALEITNGHLFALINNAGYGQPGAVEDLSRDALQQQFETNLFGLVELTNHVLPSMYQQGYGRIINVSSVLGLVAMPMRGAYIASKFALEGITDTLRLELKDTNIFVSLIEPGPIISHFRQNSLAMYKQYIEPEKSRFKHHYQLAEKKFQKHGAVVPFTLGPDAVLKKVIHALNSHTPKPRYYVTFPTYLFAFLNRILPSLAMDFLLSKASKIERK